MAHVEEFENLLFDDRTKGIPGGTLPFRLGDIGAFGWNVLREDLPLPVAVLKESALRANSAWMMEFLRLSGARIAPHGKTTMSPQLFARQKADGAWAITVATVHQLQVCRRYGFDRVVMANQLVGRQAVRYVLDEMRHHPRFDFYALVDSVELVEALGRAAREHPPGRPLQLLLEGGIAGGRAGVRDLEGALAVARAVEAAAPHLALRGVEGFEGLIQGRDDAEREARVAGFLGFLVEIARACEAEGLFGPGPVILSAGGSAFYDMALEAFARAGLRSEVLPLTRSGCYLTHDSAMYRRAFARLREREPAGRLPEGGLVPALEVWAYVQSRPEPGRAILTLGKRDVSYDADMPVPERWFRSGIHHRPEAVPDGCRVVALNDQHAHMEVPQDCTLRLGDMVGFGVSHPCTTFDKWQLLPVVDDDYTVIAAVRTFF